MTGGRSLKGLVRLLGPGLLTGAADDDPSGITTYSQSGAQFGYALCWTMFLTTPFMVAVQIVSARIGSVTGRGLAANLGEVLPPALLYGIVALPRPPIPSILPPTSRPWAKRSGSWSAGRRWSTP
jgi:Mn2+/Fe2+ NRAMP family transporter